MNIDVLVSVSHGIYSRMFAAYAWGTLIDSQVQQFNLTKKNIFMLLNRILESTSEICIKNMIEKIFWLIIK